jgi:antitoxin (DNA-binding transcriptional repressor) of toxin-antitoxin stability system
MLIVTVDEIQRDPSKYLRQVEAGETFVILQADKAIAELRPISLCTTDWLVYWRFHRPRQF